MSKKEIKLRFRNAEIPILNYNVETNREFDVRSGERYEGMLTICFITEDGEDFYTDDIIHNMSTPSGSLEIENEYTGQMFFLNDAVMMNGFTMSMYDPLTTELSFKFYYHRKNNI